MRYVQLAITLQSERWVSKNSKALVAKALGTLQGQFESLRQLDVEVILWSPPGGGARAHGGLA